MSLKVLYTHGQRKKIVFESIVHFWSGEEDMNDLLCLFALITFTKCFVFASGPDCNSGTCSERVGGRQCPLERNRT